MIAYKDNIDLDLKNILLQRVLEKWDDKYTHFKSGGPEGGLRGYINIQDEFDKDIVSRCNKEVEKIMTDLGLKGQEFGYARHFLGVNTPGAWVAPHTDTIQFISAPFVVDVKKYREIRCNFYLQRPEGGGNPCLRDIVLENSEGMGWIFNAGIPHHSTPVQGNTNRIVMSLGSIVQADKLKGLNLL
jgi:hypothetical protein